ncbi:MAG: hypothetical protein QOH50_5059 [Kribbellaceae bacterium]|nr:hypothetical protein [Kribbellaceae bacterium]
MSLFKSTQYQTLLQLIKNAKDNEFGVVENLSEIKLALVSE